VTPCCSVIGAAAFLGAATARRSPRSSSCRGHGQPGFIVRADRDGGGPARDGWVVRHEGPSATGVSIPPAPGPPARARRARAAPDPLAPNARWSTRGDRRRRAHRLARANAPYAWSPTAWPCRRGHARRSWRSRADPGAGRSPGAGDEQADRGGQRLPRQRCRSRSRRPLRVALLGSAHRSRGRRWRTWCRREEAGATTVRRSGSSRGRAASRPPPEASEPLT